MSDEFNSLPRQINASELKITNSQPNKIRYLISVSSLNKKAELYFLTLDCPEMNNSQFINAKGLWLSQKLDLIKSSYNNIITTTYSTDKSQIINVMIPWSRIEWVQNLNYVAK